MTDRQSDGNKPHKCYSIGGLEKLGREREKHRTFIAVGFILVSSNACPSLPVAGLVAPTLLSREPQQRHLVLVEERVDIRWPSVRWSSFHMELVAACR